LPGGLFRLDFGEDVKGAGGCPEHEVLAAVPADDRSEGEAKASLCFFGFTGMESLRC
jgi:hypothetical protein